MEVKFIKASPTENMTLLIETPVAREKQLAVAERLIAYGSVYAEQAGYIEEAENPAGNFAAMPAFLWRHGWQRRKICRLAKKRKLRLRFPVRRSLFAVK